MFLHFSNFDSLFRKDLSVSQKECEEVKVHLRHREKQAADVLRSHGAPPVAGLCLKCAQHEAVLAGTHINLHVQAIDRLTKSVVTHTHKTFSHKLATVYQLFIVSRLTFKFMIVH